jgi:hypothetical protein
MESFVLVTSCVGTFFCTDVEETPTTMRQWFSDSPRPLTDPSWAYAWAADSAWDRFEDDRIHRQVWLIMGGVVTDHFSTKG